MDIKKQFREGLVTQNPVLVQLLGMCSTMAITTVFFNGVGMGLSVLIILTCSNIVISALRKVIPDSIRIACFIVVIATFVTIVDLLLQAFVPALASSLGVFIPLIVVNCIILGRAEGFCYKNGVAASAVDGVFQGIGYGQRHHPGRPELPQRRQRHPHPPRGRGCPGHLPAGGRLPGAGLPHRFHAVDAGPRREETV